MNTQMINQVKQYVTQRAIFIVLILLIIGIAIADPDFLAFSTLRDTSVGNPLHGPLLRSAPPLSLSRAGSICPLDGWLV